MQALVQAVKYGNSEIPTRNFKHHLLRLQAKQKRALKLEFMVSFVALCGALWRFVALCGALWRFVALCGVLWRFVALFGVLWRFVALCGVLWRFVALFYTLWRFVALLWRFVALCGTLWRFVALLWRFENLIFCLKGIMKWLENIQSFRNLYFQILRSSIKCN